VSFKEGDSVTGHDGQQHKLAKCNRCQSLIYFVKDGDKWKLFNPDATEHKESMQMRPRAPLKRTLTIGKLFSQNYNSVRIEIAQEYEGSGDWKKQFDEVNSMVDQALASERKKIVEAIPK
jgi:hypothetical protein